MMKLRPYQQEAVNAVRKDWQSGEYRRVLVVLPTGCGKTVIFAAVIARAVKEGLRALVIAHREELLQHAHDKIISAEGLDSVFEKAEKTSIGTNANIVVGSIQTLQSDKRLAKFRPDDFDVIIVDEAHHVMADSYLKVLRYFSQAKVLGVTATPDRADRKALTFFENTSYEYSLDLAVVQGYLVKPVAKRLPLKIDISKVRVKAGDLMADDLAEVLEEYLVEIAGIMAKECKGRTTVVFLPLRSIAKRFRDCLIAAGLNAVEVDGDSPDRKEVLADFEAGRYNVLCNSMLLTEGWDCPSVDCIVVLRPTKVRSLYCQMVGRGTRLHPGKEHLLLLDFLWHTERHELCHPASLICESEEVAKKMTENLEEAAGCPVDLEEAERQASEDVVAQREASLAKKLSEMKRRKRALVDPLQFEMSIQAEDLSGYVPAFGWELAPPSDGQKKSLEKLGILPDEIDNAGKASLLLDRLHKRKEEGLTTPKQIRFLEQRGFQHVGTWRFEAARTLIDRIAGNGWRIPAGIHPQEYVPE